MSVSGALDIILELTREYCKSLGSEFVPLTDAPGRVLFNDLISTLDVPAQDNAAMDGYAFAYKSLRQENETVKLKIRGNVSAGEVMSDEIILGECVKIMTGAKMPNMCDTVIPQEFVSISNGMACFTSNFVKEGDNRRMKGEDLKFGNPVLQRGKLLSAADVGLVASLGVPEIEVYKKLRVGFFSTGNEIRSPGQELEEGCIYDSNRYTMSAMLNRLPVDVIDFGVAADNPRILEEFFQNAASKVDLIVTSGGVSVGESDFTKQVMKSLGSVEFWKIAMRPGRPMAVGKIKKPNEADSMQTMVFGLPGNPVAVMVTFFIFVLPAIRQMVGNTRYLNKKLKFPLITSIKKKKGRTEFRRGSLVSMNGDIFVKVQENQGSGILRSMSEADCLVILEHDEQTYEAGDKVSVLIFDGLQESGE
ncbi:molybdopterin molybdotransferase MoeA [Betaproteobacteria bacterium]|nr:molybdopterin molybdotransferase MoeA [Betaproteobacteria bacterium]